MTRLTDEEREIWKDLYTLHERYHDRTWEPDDWVELAGDLGRMCDGHGNHALAIQMGIGLLDYFDACWKAREAAREREGVQMEMELT